MPGIFGFVHPVANKETAQILKQMAAALHDEPSYQSFEHSESEISLGRVGLSIVQPHPQPAWNETRTVAVVMEGEIYDYAAHRTRLENKGHRFSSDSHAELFAHMYEESGPDFAAELNGAFAAALWDQPQHRLTLVNDHLALQPLYYTPNLQNGFAFASGVRALLAHANLPRRLDRLAIAQYLTFDHVLDDRTLLEDVKLLPPASIMTYANGRYATRQYWRPQYPEYYPIREEAAYHEELAPVLRRAASRQMPGPHPAGILLSGGLDSRVIAALLHEQRKGESIQTFTMGQPGCDDDRYAKEISDQLGMRHHFYHLQGDYLLKHAAHGVRLSDGLANVAHMHTLPHLSDQAQEAQVIYKGFLGDALIGYGITERHFANYAEADIARAQFEIHRDQGLILYELEALDRLMLSPIGGLYSKQVMETYAQAMRASQTALPADQRNYFDLWQRVPRMTLNGVQWVRSQAHVRLPFADKELVEFMLTVPPGYRHNRKIIKDFFIQQYPALAKIPYTETNYPMVHCRREIWMRFNEYARWSLRSLGMNWVSMPRKKRYANYNEWLRTELRAWMEDILLSSRTTERGIFEPGFVKSMVTEHVAGKNHHTRLGALMAIEMWQRQYLDGDK